MGKIEINDKLKLSAAIGVLFVSGALLQELHKPQTYYALFAVITSLSWLVFRLVEFLLWLDMERHDHLRPLPYTPENEPQTAESDNSAQSTASVAEQRITADSQRLMVHYGNRHTVIPEHVVEWYRELKGARRRGDVDNISYAVLDSIGISRKNGANHDARVFLEWLKSVGWVEPSGNQWAFTDDGRTAMPCPIDVPH